jgi:hypothetical protein
MIPIRTITPNRDRNIVASVANENAAPEFRTKVS